MNEIRITLHGNVVSEPVERVARNGSPYTTFRVATTPYRRTADGKFVDGETSFYDVIAFNALAANTTAGLRKGQPVLVEGKLAIRTYIGNDGNAHTSPQIDADHIGHDFTWGCASFERVSRAAALGHDRTADPDVQQAVRALGGGQAVGDRPDYVDADGVVDDDYQPDVDAIGTEAGRDAGVLATGDPETDDYEVVGASA